MISPELLQQMVDTIVATVNPRQIILFGSQAKGTATDRSDVDFLVVVDEPQIEQRDRYEILYDINRLLGRMLVPCDVIIQTKAEVEYWSDSLNNIIGQAFREGKMLYARS